MSRFLDEVEACVPSLRRFARALTHEADQADDLVQDCLERAIRKKRLWRPTGTVQSWLFRILVNLHRNDLRRARRRPVLVPIDGIAAEPQGEPAQPARLALAETQRALQALPVDQREALLLVALEGLTYAEAAKVLGIPRGTLMSRISRARSTLRDMTENPKPRLRTVR